MASRVILRKKRNLLFNPVNQPTRFILGFSSLGHGQPFDSSGLEGLSQSPCCPPASVGHNKEERNLFPATKDDPAARAASKFFVHSYFRVSNFGFRTEKIDFVSLSRSRWSSQYAHYISTAATDQSGLASSNGGNEQSDTKQKKEASPEECDEAVQGLSTVKAKAKAKQLEESDKSAESIIKSLWAKILGIGPAFRAIMSMSRFKFYYLLFLCVI